MNDEDTLRWAEVAAEELARAAQMTGLPFVSMVADSDGDVNIGFATLNDAEVLMILAVGGHAGPGTLYDRACGGCETLGTLDPDDAEAQDYAEVVIRSSWKWQVHPHMTGRRMGWHTMVSIPTGDANQLTANLNALRLGGLT
jgi:hypothetical protein